MSESVFWNRLPASSLVRLAEGDAIVLLPVASTEQHGPHMATGTDVFLVTEVCRRAALLVQERRPIVVAPTLWMGLAEHHVAFGGSFTVSLATWHAMLRDLCVAILRAGFKKVLIVNGHGGNVDALNALVTELTRATGSAIGATHYATFTTEAAPGILDDQEGLQHACEAETSMMMAIEPELVASDKLSDAFGPNVTRAQALARPMHMGKSFKTLTPSGVFGDARRATPAKGEALLDAAAHGLAERLIAGEPWG